MPTGNDRRAATDLWNLPQWCQGRCPRLVLRRQLPRDVRVLCGDVRLLLRIRPEIEQLPRVLGVLSEPLSVLPHHQTAATWTTWWIDDVRRGTEDPFVCESIDVGSGDVGASVGTQVSVAQIVRQNDDDIGPNTLGFRSACSDRRGNDQKCRVA